MVKKVNYTVRCFAPGSINSLSNVKVGQKFEVALSTRDLRSNGTYFNTHLGRTVNLVRGVFAVYIDIGYDQKLSEVQVPEVQVLSIFAPSGGTMNLTVGDKTTYTFTYYHISPSYIAYTAISIENALNSILGPGSVKVTNVPGTNQYRIVFVGLANKDIPTIISNRSNITVHEALKGDLNDNASFLNSLKFNGVYTNGKGASYGIDRISRLGAFAGTFELSTSEYEVVRVPMVAKLPEGVDFATQIFTPDFASLIYPYDYTLVYGNLAANPPEQSEVLVEETEVVPAALVVSKS
jgi:hypothetical protein